MKRTLLLGLLLCRAFFSAQAENPIHLELPRASQAQIIELYGQLSDRTVLSPTMPGFSVSINFTAKTKAAAAAELAHALKEKGVLVIPDGAKFVMIVPKELKSKAVPRSKKIKTPDPSNQIPPQGEVDLPNLALKPAVDFYAKLLECKFEPGSVYPPGNPTISLRTVGPMNRAEIKYALDTLFAWENIRITRPAADLIKVELISPQ